MSELSNYLENKLLDHVFRNTAYTPATTVYLALHTANPTDTGSGTDEVVGGSYARKSLTFAAASGGAITNTNTQTFTNMPSCVITFIAIWDASSGGNMLAYSSTTTITLNAADEVTLNSGIITVTLD